MSRYIDADLLMKELGITDPDCEKCGWGHKGFPYCKRDGDFVDACDAICEAPTADVRENVHAHWVGIDDIPHETFECDHCGRIEEVQDVRFLPKFCPNCGAQMDEVTE